MSTPAITPDQTQQPNEDMLALLGFHPQQIALAKGIQSGAIHPQDVLDAATPKPAPIATSSASAAVPVPVSVPAAAPDANVKPAPRPAIAGPPDASGLPVVSRPAPVTSQQVTPPTRLTEDQAELGRLNRTGSGLEQFQHRHPVLGTIARIATGVGSAMFPTVAMNIPGTDLHHEGLVREAAGRVNQDLGEEEKQGVAGKNQADIGEAQARTRLANTQAGEAGQPKPKEEEWSVIPGLIGPNGEPVQQEKNSGQVRFAALPGGVKPLKTSQETSAADVQAKEDIATKAAKGGFPLDDPKTFQKNLTAAVKANVISADEAAAMHGYQTLHGTPASNLAVHIQGQQAAQGIRNAANYYHWQDESGKTHVGRGDKVPPGTEAVPIGGEKEFSQYMAEAHVGNIVQQSFNRVAQDIDEHPELFDNAGARAILATTLEQIDRTSAGILVAGTGGSIPLPSGLGDIINTALQNKALDKKTADALKQYIADYKSVKDKVIAMQMQMQGGKIGRGSAMAFKAIADQIPNGATPDSATARRQIANLQSAQDEMGQKYGEFGDYKKVEPYQMKTGAEGGGHSFTFNGQKFSGVPDEIYTKYKGKPGFSE